MGSGLMGGGGPAGAVSGVAGAALGGEGVVSSATRSDSFPAILEARGIERVFGRGSSATLALRGVSLSVWRGEFLSVMGPSGSGKSTLLRCLGGLDAPSSGTVCLGGRPISGISESEMGRLRRGTLAFVSQDVRLVGSLSVLDNIALPLSIAGSRGEDLRRRVRDEAELFGLGSILRRYPDELSRGQRQLVSIARATAARPEVLLADEPTGALDSASARTALAVVEELVRMRGTTVVMVTHDPSAASWGQRVVFLRDGSVFAEVVRGEDPRERFFSRVIDVVGAMGGGHAG